MITAEEIGLIDEKLLATIVKYTNNVVIVTGLDGKILYTNDGFTKLTKYSAEEVIGKKPGDFLQGPKTNPETVDRIRTQLKNFERVNETIVNYSKTGEMYWLKIDINTLRDENGQPSHFLAIESDVTEMKENELIALEQSKRINDNITYALKLQNALFRNSAGTSKLFSDLFIYDYPKDTVGGDFYIIDQIQNKKVVFVGDCTGHGVSGAIMTAIATSSIRAALQQYKTLSPSLILTQSIESLQKMLHSDMESVDDSFEGSLLFIDERNQTIRYASVGMDIFLYSKDRSEIIKGDKEKELFQKDMVSKSERVISYKKNDMIYLCTDGFKDQFGGAKDKKYSTKRMNDLFAHIYSKSCDEQLDLIESEMGTWKENSPQTDDMLMIGIKL